MMARESDQGSEADDGQRREEESDQGNMKEQGGEETGMSGDGEGGKKDEEEPDEEEKSREFLPREVQEMIIKHVLDISSGSRFTLEKVNSFFRTSVKKYPRPTLHVSDNILYPIPRPTSVN